MPGGLRAISIHRPSATASPKPISASRYTENRVNPGSTVPDRIGGTFRQGGKRPNGS